MKKKRSLPEMSSFGNQSYFHGWGQKREEIKVAESGAHVLLD